MAKSNEKKIKLKTAKTIEPLISDVVASIAIIAIHMIPFLVSL